MVPPEHKAPWLAGGGATVRTVSDEPKDSPIAPFVCCLYPGKEAKWQGKRGTLAIMADGKVRFIPETIQAATFRALCTIAGGETIIGRLDDLCPVIEAEEGSSLRTEVPGAVGGGAIIPVPPGNTTRPADGPPATGTDQERIQGTWVCAAMKVDGQVQSPKSVRFRFQGNQGFSPTGDGKEFGRTFSLKPTSNPKEFDFSLGGAGTQKGIYELEGDNLRLCLARDGATPRPTSFDAPKGSNAIFMVLTRSR